MNTCTTIEMVFKYAVICVCGVIAVAFATALLDNYFDGFGDKNDH